MIMSSKIAKPDAIKKRRIAIVALHFGKLPEQFTDDEINEYLASVTLNPRSPSHSNFKYAVYGLRYYFRRLIDEHCFSPEQIPGLKQVGLSARSG
jgi:hypothetical protein